MKYFLDMISIFIFLNETFMCIEVKRAEDIFKMLTLFLNFNLQRERERRKKLFLCLCCSNIQLLCLFVFHIYISMFISLPIKTLEAIGLGKENTNSVQCDQI